MCMRLPACREGGGAGRQRNRSGCPGSAGWPLDIPVPVGQGGKPAKGHPWTGSSLHLDCRRHRHPRPGSPI